jgi:hypothetical protein
MLRETSTRQRFLKTLDNRGCNKGFEKSVIVTNIEYFNFYDNFLGGAARNKWQKMTIYAILIHIVTNRPISFVPHQSCKICFTLKFDSPH